jgi:hypothetical protein
MDDEAERRRQAVKESIRDGVIRAATEAYRASGAYRPTARHVVDDPDQLANTLAGLSQWVANLQGFHQVQAGDIRLHGDVLLKAHERIQALEAQVRALEGLILLDRSGRGTIH